MSGYCFYSPEASEIAQKFNVAEIINEFAECIKRQTYVLRRPLTKEDAEYEYEDAIVIFSAGRKPYFIDLGGNKDDFGEYVDDFLEDVSYLAEKFKYKDKIGRKKHWIGLFQKGEIKDINFEVMNPSGSVEARIADLVTSLVIGSINDVDKIDLEAEAILDKIKSKIILFDTDQTSFVFKTRTEKKIAIQGLAGSGKTELLLHKLKEIYSYDVEAKIAFTCFNKILASSMRARIPEFFDFMRVERQIDWNEKLFCFHAWGSSSNPVSGMYRYICYFYGLQFGNMYSGTFDQLCQKAKVQIESLGGEKKFAFDYVFIDESQDFPESFIELCSLVTSKKVFVAGDVFQNIFRPIDERVNSADMVLKKCYRTDPKNLMFSHALGMGLYEDPVLRWLQPQEWDACGYVYEERNNKAILSRDALRRFEDIPDDFVSTYLQRIGRDEDISDSIIRVVQAIKARHPTVVQGDIAVLFLDKDSYIYDEIPALKSKINQSMGWDSNVSYESKRRDPDSLFISNINNAKGLEFPFVICYAKDLRKVPSFRNALYTMMARSFLESHLLLGENTNVETLEKASSGLNFLKENGFMELRIPTNEEIAKQKDFLVLNEKLSVEEMVREYCENKDPTPRLLAKLISRAKEFAESGDFDKEILTEFLDIEYKRNLKL